MLKLLILILFGMFSTSLELLFTPKPFSQCGMPVKFLQKQLIEQNINSQPWGVSMSCDYRKTNGEIEDLGHMCGGALISPRHVLTAAHCVQVPNAYMIHSYDLNELNPTVESVFRVRVSLKEKEYDTKLKIKKIKVHEKFDKATMLNDIALVELAEPVQFNSSIYSVCLPDQEIQGYPSLNTSAYLVGWFNQSNPRNLKRINVNIMSDEYCKNFSQSKFQICAHSEDKYSVCKGDSGGPLIIKSRDCDDGQCYVLAGITSYVIGKKSGAFECNSQYPTFFTRVSAYTPWIRMNMYGENF